MAMRNAKRCSLLAVLIIIQAVYLCFHFLHFKSSRGTEVRVVINDTEVKPDSYMLVKASSAGHMSYSESERRVLQYRRESIYRYDRDRNLPLMKLTPDQLNRIFRIALARRWLKSQKLVVAASVRNAMNGLESSVAVIRQLASIFHSVTAVFVENDSTDNTRRFLYDLTMQSTATFRVLLLGCGNINSPDPCHLNISYGTSGRRHRSGHIEQAGRSLAEESTDRGLVMAALRNMYLQFIYSNVSADLMLVLESDLRWSPWSMDSIAQGLYYFKAKPVLDSLCAFTTYVGGIPHDPCTLIFHHNKEFYVDAAELGPFIDRTGTYINRQFGRHIGSNSFWHWSAPPAEPVKVASCFQGAAFYRVSSLRAASAFYRYSEGEWHCEHSTLSMQLRENYLDTQMRVGFSNHEAG